MNKKDESSDMLGKVAAVAGAVVAGVAVGATAVVMADPKKRKQVIKKLNDIKDMAEDTATDAVKHGQKVVDQVTKELGNAKDALTEKLGEK